MRPFPGLPVIRRALAAGLATVLGYDVATGVLRVEIIQPGVCEVATTVYEYQAS